MYQILDEQLIFRAAEATKDDDPNNTFSYALKIANLYKKADLTPVFILNSTTKTLHVTTEEVMDGNYH
jgi:hypothetical protein